AIMSAPVEDRAAWQRHMAQLALHAGQALLARVQAGAGDAGERIDTLRAAIAWFESGLTVAADDETLHDAVRTARASLWPTYEEAVTALLQRQEFHVAGRWLREAQADEDCPPPVQASFREMLAATFGGEVGQLTADAIRRMQEGKEEECLAALDRAETLLGTIPEEGIAPKRRQELERRLWWGYTKLGIRRVDGGMWEEALEPLLRALNFQGVGADRPLTLGQILDEAAERHPLAAAVIAGSQRLRYRELRERVDVFARGLLALGLGPGDHVVVWMPNCIEWNVVNFALAKIGAVTVTCNSRYRPFEVEYLVGQSDARALVMMDRFPPAGVNYNELVREVVPDVMWR